MRVAAASGTNLGSQVLGVRFLGKGPDGGGRWLGWEMSEPRQFIGWEEMLWQELVETAVIDLADECSHDGVIALGG